MDYHLARNGQQLGVMSDAQIRQGLNDGTVQTTDILWTDGMTDWKPVSEVFKGQAASPAIPTIPVMTRPVSVLPMSTATPPATGLAITSLVMGILGFATCGLTSIVAIVCGHIAKSRIKSSSGTMGGSGMALTGLILGYICIALLPIAILSALALPTFNSVQQRALMAKSMSNVKQIITGCKIYAADHEGKYPNDLTDLKKEDIISDAKVFQDPLLKNGSEIGYEYLGAGMKDSDAPDKVVLKSKGTSMRKRVIGLNNGSVSAVKETPAK